MAQSAVRGTEPPAKSAPCLESPLPDTRSPSPSARPPRPLGALRPASPSVGRFAPSPTGRLHLGHARTFLLAWWRARSRDGRILLRLEDLDGSRTTPELCAATLTDLTWLGLDWDGPERLQSTGLERYRAALSSLGPWLYPCVCSRAELRVAQHAPQQGDVEPRYPGTCRDRFPDLAAAEAATGRPPGLRFRVPEGQIPLIDGFAGPFTHDVAAEVGDFLVGRRDGSPAYQLAVVVDDAADGVNEVLRGDDLLPSTPRQYLLQQALALPSPTWFHVPLVVDANGRRLAKRADDLSLAALREGGTDPRAIVAWAARSAGIPGVTAKDRPTPRECLGGFSLGTLPKDPVILDGPTVAGLRAAR